MKEVLRAQLRALLREYAAKPAKAVSVDLIPATLLQTAGTIFSFLSTPLERSTDAAISQALECGKSVAVPKITGPGEMAFYPLLSASGPFVRGNAGIREPVPLNQPLWAPDKPAHCQLPLLVLVPALAFTRSGHRLGQGGGYYDRFLTKLLQQYASRRPEILLAGWCYPLQIIQDIPVSDHDVPVDCLLTGEECIFVKNDGGSLWEK